MSKPQLYSVYKHDNCLWLVTDNKDIHNIKLELVNEWGTWIACFDEKCNKFDGKDLEKIK